MSLQMLLDNDGGVRRPPWVGLWSLVLMFAAMAVGAQDWRIQPTASVRVSFEDNIFLDEEHPTSSFGANGRVAVRAFRGNRDRSLALLAGVSANKYLDVDNKDNTIAFIGLEGLRSSERNRFGMNVNLSTQSTLTSETATTGPSKVNRQQFRVDVRPSWSYSLSQRASIGASLDYIEVLYDDTSGTFLNNYRAGSLALSVGYRVSERASVNAVGSYGRYVSQGGENETQNFSFQAGGEYWFSELWVGNLLFGLRQTETRSGGGGGGDLVERSVGPSYSLGVNRTFRRGGNLQLRAVRELATSGFAGVLDTTSLLLRLRYPVDDRLSVDLVGRAFRNREPGGERSVTDRTYMAGEMQFAYRMHRSWKITLGYRHRWQDRDANPGTAQGNALSLTLAWNGS